MNGCSTEGARALAALADTVGRASTLRTDGAPPVASTSVRAPIASRAEGDWAAFARPQPSHLSSSPVSSFGGSPGTLAEWLERFHSTDGETSDGHVSGSDISWKWAPEVQTSLEVSRALASSPALSASSYDCPTPEEVRDRPCCRADLQAEHVCCSADSARGRKLGRAGELPDAQAHELTLFPSPTAVWNHDALFSTRRRWFGGRRVAATLLIDDDVLCDLPGMSGSTSGATTGPQSGVASPSHPTLRTRSQSRSHSRLCEEIVPASTSPPPVASEGRAATVHAQLRETAMTRLGGIMRHLGLAATAPPSKRSHASSSSS